MNCPYCINKLTYKSTSISSEYHYEIYYCNTCKKDITNQKGNTMDVVEIVNKHHPDTTLALQRSDGVIVCQRTSSTIQGATVLINDVIRDKKYTLRVYPRVYSVSEKRSNVAGKICMQLSYADVSTTRIVVRTTYGYTKADCISRLKKSAKKNNWRVYDNGSYWNE